MKKYYTYLIGWSKQDKWYYGVRYSKHADPSELWVTYFTSSKHVKRFREEHGEPDIIEVRQTFDRVDKARLWEHKVLKRMQVVNDDRWLNMTDNKAVSIESALVGATKKKPWKPDDYRRKLSSERMYDVIAEYGRHTWSKEKRSEVAKRAQASRSKEEKIRISKIATKASAASPNKVNWSNNGLAKDLYLKRRAQGTEPQTMRTECPHCLKVGQYRAMKRWHYDRCKLRP